jgi:hypothetical protein
MHLALNLANKHRQEVNVQRHGKWVTIVLMESAAVAGETTMPNLPMSADLRRNLLRLDSHTRSASYRKGSRRCEKRAVVL